MNSVYYKSSLLYKFYKFWLNYFSPANFSYWWNFGSMALMCLILQMVTGLFLAMHYKSDANLAFASVEYMSSEVQYGWFISYMHSNGASVFFMVVYLHMLRALMHGSFFYPRHLLWTTGVVMFLLMMATSFFGYVLPWGQMSFWAATVIISLFSAMPLVGPDIVLWLWGGFSVDDATSNSFFSLHFFLPFVMLGLSMMHLMLLHEFGSNNPMGTSFRSDGLPMGPYYIVKDLNGMNILFIFFVYLVHFIPNFLGHPDNYISSNPLVTPPHMVPEWYFLPLYAMLSSIPNKLLGVIALFFATLTMLVLPLLAGKNNIISSFFFKPFLKILMVFIIFNSIILGWMGGQPVVPPYYFMGQIATFMYYLLFFSFMFIGFFEQMVSKVYSKKNSNMM